MENKNKIILDLCGGTGAWSRPYKEAGYDVRVITLPNYDVRDYIPPKNVYGVLAAPPCHHFSVMRCNTAKTKRNLTEAMDIVRGCLNIIWLCQYGEKKLNFWALENPSSGMIIRFIGKPFFEFNPWDFGDRASKKTGVWGYFNIPQKNPIPLTEEEKEYQRKNHIHRFPSAKEYPGISRRDRRAITPAGFANAFFKANP
jgi:hypothetical protein